MNPPQAGDVCGTKPLKRRPELSGNSGQSRWRVKALRRLIRKITTAIDTIVGRRMMVVHGTTDTKLGTEAVDLWVNQFDREDRSDARRLLSAIRNVGADEFHNAMTELVRSRVEAHSAPVGLYVETERRHRRGRSHRLFLENGRKHRRAFGNGPRPILPMMTIDPEVGSEGLIAQIVTQVFRQNKERASSHPGPDIIRKRKIRRFILVTDFIGSGDRIIRYLDAAWNVRSVRSWWSARRSKGMSFEVLAYSATEAGSRKIEGHPTRPIVHIFEGCPTIEQVFKPPEVRDRIKELCTRYGSFNSKFDPLGYGGSAALITFAHGMPNNAPAIFHKRSNLKTRPWTPLYPERVTSGRRTGSATIAKQNEAIQLDLQRLATQRMLLSPRLSSAPSGLRDAVHVLLSLDHAPRSESAISARTGLSVTRVRNALACNHKYGWVDDDNRMADKGRRELARLAAPVRREIQFESASLYIPRSLRAPRTV